MNLYKVLAAKAFLFFLFNTQWLQAQKYSNEFLSIGVGARAQALGNAVVAGIDDVTAGYWNPAGLSNLSKERGLVLGAMHSEWFAGVGKYDYLGMSLPMANGKSRMGLSLIRFGIDNIPNTLSLFEPDGTVNYNNIVEFSAADYAFLGSYARRLISGEGKSLSIGGNVKVIRRIIGSFANSWGFGLDLGAQYRSGNFRAGLMARDLTSTFNAWRVTFTDQEKDVLLSTGNELPDINSLEVTKPQVLLGVSYFFKIKKFDFRPEVNLVATTDGRRNTLLSGDPVSIDPGIGLEVDYNDFLFIRAGVHQFQKEQDIDGGGYYIARPALGLGLQMFSLRLDYAYTNPGDSRNLYSHVVSLQLEIKPREAAQQGN
jgi:hypothetical protein